MAGKRPRKRSSQRGRTSKPAGQGRADAGKVGSDPAAAREFGGEKDFGVAADDRIEREYASREIKYNDPGGAPPHSAPGGGTRTTGAGGNATGPASSSGGDLDPDIVGVGTGGSGIAQSGPEGRIEGPDITEGGSGAFASGGPSAGQNVPDNTPEIVEGSTIDRSGGDVSTTGEGAGPSAVTNPRGMREDDSFAGEISASEATGGDNSDSDKK